jgi:ATP-dependent exoDNAse (exonuclease V) beta subunit
MEQRQILDFSGLEERAVRLLRRSETTCERLRRQIRIVMVDEAQDLNPLQYELLGLIGTGRELLVGDTQQSIYGFRQADVRHFSRRASSGASLRLSRNYRSQPGILSFVDFVFGNEWRGDYLPMSDTAAPMDLDGDVPRGFGGVEIWRQEAEDWDGVAEHVGELLAEGIAPKEIAVLVRDGGGAQRALAGLQGAGIPARVAGGSERFYTRLEVRDLANALRAIADPYDDFSVLACLRSPFVGLSLDSVMLLGRDSGVIERLESFEPPVERDAELIAEFLGWYRPLRGIADRLAAWEVLAELFAKTPLLTTLARRDRADQLLANVRKLLALAVNEPELGPLEFAERIREIQDLRHKEGDAPADEEDANVVTIMTVHKSKGLEFPVVVLPQTNKNLAAPPRDLVVEPRLGLVCPKFGRFPSLMYKYLADLRRTRDEAEELRVLYVALTRAQKRLCICTYPPKRDRTFSKIISDAIGSTPPAGIRVRDATNSTG